MLGEILKPGYLHHFLPIKLLSFHSIIITIFFLFLALVIDVG